jgi:hypothetical protein
MPPYAHRGKKVKNSAAIPGGLHEGPRGRDPLLSKRIRRWYKRQERLEIGRTVFTAPAPSTCQRAVPLRDIKYGGTQPRRSDGRFDGGRRVNVESSPRLPAWLLGRIWDYGHINQIIELRWEAERGDALSFLASRRGDPDPRVWVCEAGGFLRAGLRLSQFPLPNGARGTLLQCPGDCEKWIRHCTPTRLRTTRSAGGPGAAELVPDCAIAARAAGIR